MYLRHIKTYSYLFLLIVVTKCCTPPEKNVEKDLILKEFINSQRKIDSLNFNKEIILTNIVRKYLERQYYNESVLFVYIPPEVCWTCILRKIERVQNISYLYPIKVVYMSDYQYVRSVKVAFPEEETNIWEMKKEWLDSLSQYGPPQRNNLLFFIIKDKNNRLFPYGETGLTDPVTFLEKNYYEKVY